MPQRPNRYKEVTIEKKISRKPRAKRSLGQNFLTALWPVRTMAKAADVGSHDTVLEIGPGKGILTKELLFAGAHVIAVEKDDALYAALTEKFKEEIHSKKLTLILGDILEQDIQKITGKKPYKVVANIPYNITGLLIPFFLESQLQPTSITFLVQKEVANRICSKDKKESILSLSVKVFGTPVYVEKVSRSLFRPAPNVDSAIIHIKDIHPGFKNTKEKERFFEIIKKAFNSRRKKISSTLKGYTIPEDLKDKRPEELSVQDFLTRIF
ncbi:MAG: 16S rRNA (adenine(1518)-N(6)/adenine(1519)-N(6))-dimethyltransferase RsmA [Minisyncoccia bacterium]